MNFLTFALCFILITSVASQEDDSGSSLKLRMNQRGINFLKDVALSAVERDAIPLNLSAVSASKVLVRGLVASNRLSAVANFTLTGLVLERLSFMKTAMLPNPPRTLFLNASLVQGMLSGEHEVNVSFLGNVIQRQSGVFEANFQSGIFVSLGLGQSENRFLADVTAAQCATQIYSINVQSRGTDAGDPDFALEDIIVEDLASLLKTELCSTLINAALNIFNGFIGGVRADFPVLEGIGLDLSLVGPPVASTSYFDVNFNGKCYSLAQPNVTPPYVRETLPEPTVSTAMGQVLVGNYVIQTCLHSLFGAGVFNITVDLDTLEVGLPFTVDSTFLGRVVPPLLTLAGPNRPIRIRTTASTPPTIAIRNSEITTKGIFDIVVAVINDSQESRPSLDAFTLQAELSATGRMFVQNATISGVIEDLDLNLSFKSSNIGQINVGLIKLILGGSLPGTLLPAINRLLGNGISIPSGLGFNLVNVEFTFFEGAIELRGDVAAKRSSSSLNIASILSAITQQ